MGLLNWFFGNDNQQPQEQQPSNDYYEWANSLDYVKITENIKMKNKQLHDLYDAKLLQLESLIDTANYDVDMLFRLKATLNVTLKLLNQDLRIEYVCEEYYNHFRGVIKIENIYASESELLEKIAELDYKIANYDKISIVNLSTNNEYLVDIKSYIFN